VATNAGALVRSKPSELGLTEAEAKTLADHVKSAASELSQAGLDDVLPIERALAEAAAGGAKAELRSRSSNLAHEGFVTLDVMRTVHEQLDIMSLQLKGAAGCGPSKVRTDCRLQDLIDGLAPTFEVTTDASQVYRMQLASERAANAIERFMIDCMCAATNPPCPPCDDPAVLLARIDVDGCKVVRICNTVRRYVYAPSSLRYWDAIDVPQFFYCCGLERREITPPSNAVDNQLEIRGAIEKLQTLSAAHASMRAVVTPPTPPSALAVTHEAEVAELRTRLNALERKLAKLEKPSKDKTS
jgi:hypothetical protein